MTTEQRLIRVKEVLHKTGLSRATLYRLINAARFPKPVNISEGAVAWVQSEVESWVAQRISEREQL